MPHAFDFSVSPFDCLDVAEQKIVREGVEVVSFGPHETIVGPGVEPSHLFVITEGHVSQFDGGEWVASYGPDDCFDRRALIAGRASTRFVAADAVVAYRLAKAAFNALIARNAMFGALMFADLSDKLGALAQRRGQHELQTLTMSRVDEAFLRPASVVDGGTAIVEVAATMQAQRSSSVLVRDGDRLGIFTNTGLQRAVADGRPLATRPVRELATFDLVTIGPRAPLFDALALMIEHQVHRLVVADGARILGLLEQLDLLSFLSNHSYLITVQIVQARDLDALREQADRITRFIALMHRGGTRVGQMGTLVQALNAKLFARAWELVAPPELVADSCLFVMGSEGRGEQLLKTDQDNGLILRDGSAVDAATVAAACERFSAALRGFGYPDCPGGIMVSNPSWRRSAGAFKALVRQWLLRSDAEGRMALAIFVDAHAVAGDAALLDDVRGEVERVLPDDDAWFGRFAGVIDLFPDAASSWWSRLLQIGEHDGHPLDLKKAGIFPIVHGVRSLALRARIRETATTARLDALVARGEVPAALAADVVESLHFLLGLKLKAGLAELDAGKPVSGAVRNDRLGSLERDLLRDALAVVRRFKALVRDRFHLEPP